MTKGHFITFEGPEGSGKSTQLRILAARLREIGFDVVETREPGGTPIGEHIREILLRPDDHGPRPTAELLLMFASRAQNVDEGDPPCTERDGKIVIVRSLHRFDTLAYQGMARGLGADTVYDVDRIACRGLVPHLTLLIDIDIEIGLARAEQTRMEQQPASFHREVRDAYHQLARDEPKRIRIIDGARDRESVAQTVWNEVSALLEK